MEDHTVPAVEVILGTSLVMVMIIGVAGNLAGFFYFRTTQRNNLPDLIYSIISLTDICTSTLTLPVIDSVFNGRRPGLFSHPLVCSSWAILFNFSQRYSIFMAMMMAVSRSIAIHFPFYTINKAAVVVACLVYGLFLITLDSIYIGLDLFTFTFSGLITSSCTVYSTLPIPNSYWTTYSILYLIEIVGIITIIFISFVITIRRIAEEQKNSTEVRRPDGRYSRTRRTRHFKQVSMTIALFTLVVLLCNMPIFILQLLDNVIFWFKVDNFLTKSWLFLTYGPLLAHVYLTAVNAALNPCLYLFRMSRFRAWMLRSNPTSMWAATRNNVTRRHS